MSGARSRAALTYYGKIRDAMWDIAPFAVLFEEAGARFTEPSGMRRWPTRSGLAAGPRVHDALVRLIGDQRA